MLAFMQVDLVTDKSILYSFGPLIGFVGFNLANNLINSDV